MPQTDKKSRAKRYHKSTIKNQKSSIWFRLCRVGISQKHGLKELTLHNWRSQQGFAILWIIAIIIAFATLGSAMVATYNVSLFGQVETGLSLAAESMAESGYRFLFSEYQNKATDADKNELLDKIRFVGDATGKIFNISPGGGQFQLEMTSYFYRVETDPGGGSSLALKFIGSEGFSVPGSGFLKIGQDETFYEYTSAPGTSVTDGETTYTFAVTPNVPATPVYTTVRPVVQTTIGSPVNEFGTLTLATDQGDLFPPENGMFFITKQKIKANLPVVAIVPYRYEYRNGDQLINVQKGPHHGGFTTIDAGSTKIEVAKFLSVESIGFAPDKASDLARETNTFKLSLDISASTPGLKSYWSFDDSGTPGKDDYGTSDGTLEGSPTPVAGKVGGALEFSGAEAEYVSTTFNPRDKIGNNQSFTVVFWAKPDTITGTTLRTVFGIAGGQGDINTIQDRFYIAIYDREWLWGFGNRHGLSYGTTLPTATLYWQHVAYVYDSDGTDCEGNPCIILYINGIKQYWQYYDGNGTIADLSVDLGAMSREGGTHAFPFDGTIDEVAIFNTALDICEIREIYNVPCNVGCGIFNTANDLGPGVVPVAYYPFNCDENDDNQSSCSAGTVVDESGTDKDGNPSDNNNGTVSGATLTTDRFGCLKKAYSFDGSAHIEVPHSDSLDMSNDGVPSLQDMTVAVWVKKDVAENKKIAIVQKSDRSYILRFDNNDRPQFIIDDVVSGKGLGTAEANDPVDPGVWYHLVGTYDGTNVEIYVDGVPQAVPALAPNGMKDDNNRPLGIGANLDRADRELDGQIDDISIWDQALLPDQVSDYYYQTSHKEF